MIRPPRIVIGITLTLVWFSVTIALLHMKRAELSSLTLNEWGDFLAGVCSPIAFLWLILGYLQQGSELKQNTLALKQQEEALRLQAQELRSSVEQQTRIAELAREELESNRAASFAEYQNRKRSAQPIVKLQGIRSSLNRNQNLLFNYVALENIGHIVTNVTFELVHSIDMPSGISVHQNQPENWAPGHGIEFRIVTPNNLPAGTKFEVALNYVDGMGEAERKPFSVEIRKGGSLQISETLIPADGQLS